jgi:hypothetical protein
MQHLEYTMESSCLPKIYNGIRLIPSVSITVTFMKSSEICYRQLLHKTEYNLTPLLFQSEKH